MEQILAASSVRRGRTK